mmetsp:Transcript_29386/g.83647  ORF Transcript_29386/g.83647 Transcript_29386/m.83647 type:complete len:457 (+) Transcript_29386:300-1670(+)
MRPSAGRKLPRRRHAQSGRLMPVRPTAAGVMRQQGAGAASAPVASVLRLLGDRRGRPASALQGPVHELQQRLVQRDLRLGHERGRLRQLVRHLLLDVLGVLHQRLSPVQGLFLLGLVVLIGVPRQDMRLDVLELLLVLAPHVLLLHLPEEVGLVLKAHLLQPVLLHILRLEEVPVHLLLLGSRSGCVVVAGILLLVVDIGLQFRHEVVLPLDPGVHLLLALLLLLLHGAGVVLHRLSLLRHLLLLLLLALLLVERVLLEHLPHRLPLLCLFPLELLLLGLHLVDDLRHQLGLLVLLPLHLLVLQLSLVLQLEIPVGLLAHDLVLLLLLALPLHLLPALQLGHLVLVVDALLVGLRQFPMLLLCHLSVQVHLELPLQGLGAKLLADAVLLMQVGRVLVQLRPIVDLGPGARLVAHDAGARHRGHAPRPGHRAVGDGVRGDLRGGVARRSRPGLQPPL